MAPASTNINSSSSSNHGSSKLAPAGSNRPVNRAVPDRSKSADAHELTAVDKKWGVLFDPSGQPTARFVQAMNSLSQYIINAFLKTDSIVLVPEKLSSFYNFHTVETDPFHYNVIFQSSAKGSYRSLTEFYQDIGCAFHLVQATPSSPPRVPGLTPAGFARWMTLQLQAFPDEVAARLDRVISDFPLEAVSTMDGKSERLPKQLSRYLLPKTPDAHIRALLQQAVKRHFGEAALAPLAATTKPRRAISLSDGEDNVPRRKPDAIIKEHRRYNSYSGPASQPQTDRGRAREPALERRGRRDSHNDKSARRDTSRSRPRPDRRSTEPSRRMPADMDDSTRAPAQSQLRPQAQPQPSYRRHQHRHSYDCNDGYTSRRHSERPSSPGARVSRDSRDSRRSRNPTHSQSSAFVQPGSSMDKKPNSSLRRRPSPQSRGYQASLPEIHTDGIYYSGSGPARDARGHASVASSHRSSVNRSSGRGSIDTAPSSVSGRPEREDDDKKPKLRDVCYKATARGDGDGDKNYRVYRASLSLSPLSTSPVLMHAPTAQDGNDNGRRDRGARSESANTKAKLVGSDARDAFPSTRRTTYRLQPTVTDDRYDGGSDSDKTWDEYLRTEDSQ